MTISDAVLILATLMGPILAVQAQKIIEKNSEGRRRKVQIFQTMMATRAIRLAPDHVAALNSIDLEFSSKKDKKVIEAWRLYALQLEKAYDPNNEAQTVEWNSKVYDLFIDLLYVMSQSLKYDFSKDHLQRGIYYPTGHADREASQLKVLFNAAKVLAGEQPIKMAVTEFPVSAEVLNAQILLQEKLANAFDGGALTVQVLPESGAGTQ